MATVRVEVDSDHLARLFGAPKSGVAELIWNALDADASTVEVFVDRGGLGGVDLIRVADNGHGLTLDDATNGFGHLGGSWKHLAEVTRGQKRRLHGAQGKGRYAAFSLGEEVEWRTVALTDNGLVRFSIHGAASSPATFEVTDPAPAPGAGVGTEVRISTVADKAARWLDRPDRADELVSAFALYLTMYPDVKITVDGAVVNPAKLQVASADYTLTVADVDGEIGLKIIEWERDVDRAIYFCGSSGTALFRHHPVGVHAAGFHFTAYLTSDEFKKDESLLVDMGGEPATSILQAAQDRIRQHFKDRADAVRQSTVDQWIDDGVYPYVPSSHETPTQVAERQTFDVVALAAASTINKGEPESKKLSLRLLKEAIETRPGALHHILREVLNLSDVELDDLADMLEKTSLGAVIAASRLISDRLDFIAGLDALVFDNDLKKATTERRQLHRILANETWLFADEYSLTGDDDRLTTVLKKHLALLDEAELYEPSAALTRPDGTEAIPDLVLSRATSEQENQLRHLVVELKRPSVNVGVTQFRQIQDYALAVTRDPRFMQGNVRWDFWIVGNEVSADVRAMMKSEQPGVAAELLEGRVKIRVRTWAEVLSDARHRLKFVQKALDYQATHDSGIEYLNRKHQDLLPDAALTPESGASSALR